MNNRLKQLRKDLGFTMEAFGARIGIDKSAVSSIESGRNALTEGDISLICKEFHVNEEWLRTGKGEIYIRLSEDEEIAELMGRLMAGAEEDAILRRIVRTLGHLEKEDLLAIEKLANEMTNSSDDANE